MLIFFKFLLTGLLLSLPGFASGPGTIPPTNRVLSWEDSWLSRYRATEQELLPEYSSLHDYFLAGLGIQFGTNPYPASPREYSHPHFSRPFHLLSSSRPENRETVLLLMGLHEDSGKPYYRFINRTLIEAGYNVIALPNPFSDEYRRAQPRLDCPPGKISCETQVALEIFSGLLSLDEFATGKEKIHLLGFSYGSVLASSLRALAPDLVTGQTLLLSPVFNFTQTIARLDQAFARDLNPFPENYDPLREVLSLERDAHLPWISREEIESRAAKMTSLAFFEKLSGNLGGLRERGQCSQDKVKYISEDPPRRLNFTALIEACAAEMGNEHAPNQLSLENLWTDSNRGGQITLLTTTDDPLNSRGEAERFKATFTGRARVLILPFGGHTGFVYSDWLKHFLRRAFKD